MTAVGTIGFHAPPDDRGEVEIVLERNGFDEIPKPPELAQRGGTRVS